MQKLLVALSLALSLVLSLAGAALAQAPHEEPHAPAEKAPEEKAPEEKTPKAKHESHGAPEVATIGLYVSDVREIDLKKGTFEATLYYWIRHPKQADKAREKEFEDVDFVNGKLEGIEEQDRSEANGQTYAAWKGEGVFHFFPELRKYPFDEQKIEIEFEHPSLEVTELVYKDDTSSYERAGQPKEFWGLGKHVVIPEYEIKRVEREVQQSLYETDFGDPGKKEPRSTYSRYVVTITLARLFQPYFFKILLPLMVILSMAYLVFWLPAAEIHPATELSITALLSCFAFNVAVSASLPEIGYLVVSDKFFIWTYFLLFLNLTMAVILFNMDHHGHHDQAHKGGKICRVAFPLLYASGFIFLVTGALK